MRHRVLLPAVLSALAGVCAFGADTPQYGAASRIAWLQHWNYAHRDEILSAMRDAGIEYARTDCTWKSVQKEKGGAFDFSALDAAADSADKAGITLLPLLQEAPDWALPQVEHLDLVREWIRAFFVHYGSRFPAVEFWNEPNSGFWQGKPSADEFYKVLKVAYETAQETGTNTKIVFGGTTGVPLDYFERAFKLGALKYCDAVACHPYSFPAPLEGGGIDGWVENSIDRLKALMVKYGGIEKPIWITEAGWPTHTVNADPIGLVHASLKVARPEKTAWNIIYAANVQDGMTPDHTFARILGSQLPKGSKVEACTPLEVCRRLKEGDVDAVMYPGELGRTERYPEATADAVVDFVRRGGTLIAMNGNPMWIGCGIRADGTYGDLGEPRGRHLADLRVSMRQKSEIPTLPPEYFAVRETDAAVAAGYPHRNKGNVFGCVFFDGRLLKGNDSFVPLMCGRDPKTGEELCATGVYVFDSDMRGRVIVSGMVTCGGAPLPIPPNSEEEQARLLVRAHAFAFAKGVDKFFIYCFRAFENNPLNSEAHYGIVHKDLSPKPAYNTMRTLTRFRPSGSVAVDAKWRSDDGRLIFPQWTRPDGKRGGMIWTTGVPRDVELVFEPGEVGFADMYGRRIEPTQAKGAYRVHVSERPVYFRGGLKCRD